VPKTNFEELRVYQIAETLSDQIWEIMREWDNLAKDTVGKQVVRSADSIGANIAEGSGRGTAVDNRRFLCMARGSLYETQHWLRRAYRRQLLSPGQIDGLKVLISELAPVLNAYMRSVAKAAQNQKSSNATKQSSKL
jgi:four helix bundle protein